jgi:signal transduction histidine kinase
MVLDLAPYAGLLLALAACVALAAKIGRLRHDLARASAMRETAQGAEQTATRLLRLAAHELRGIGMTLHGHADRLSSPEGTGQIGVHAMGLAAASAQVLGLADELQDHTMPDIGTQSLREELVDPREVLNAVVEAAALALEPGRRHWRVSVTHAPYLWADRRALRHILGRVLGDAARNTRQDDVIELRVLPHAEGLCVQVEDEGTGLASPEPVPGAQRDSRGIGQRLALARSLMLAHGGRLEVEAAAQVGTSVRLIFPATRLRDANGLPVAPQMPAMVG